MERYQTTIHEKWDKLTNEDIEKIDGEYERFLERLQTKYGYTKEQAEEEIKNWQESHKPKSSHLEGHDSL